MTTPEQRAAQAARMRAYRATLATEPKPPGFPAYRPHGSYAGWRRHQRAGEEPCDPCRLAYNEYQRGLHHQRGVPPHRSNAPSA